MASIGIPGLGGILGGGALDLMLPGILMSIGTSLQNKDANKTGADDEGGRVICALAPMIPSIIHGDVRHKQQVVDAAIAALQSYRASLD